MRPTVSQYAEALEALSKEGMSAQDLARNFLGFLKRRRESDRVMLVTKQLENRSVLQSGTLRVTVVTAFEPGEEMKQLLVKQAERIFPGMLVQLQYEVDTAVIGGAQFRTDEVLYDATVSAKLGVLKKVIHK